jgi:hypothetical protein
LELDPEIISSDAQQVSFTIKLNDTLISFSAIYASTNYITRSNLWNSLSLLLNHHNLPWCFIGDFNSIIRAHEHRGRFNPARSPMEDFQSWSDSYNLIHLNTRGSEFTWFNGRDGNSLTKRKLDRVICNQALIYCCSSLSTTNLSQT